MNSAARTDYVAEALRLFHGTIAEAPRYRPGINFKNGKLYVFSTTRIIVMAPWPEMRAWTKTKARPQWRACRPFIRLYLDDVGKSYIHTQMRRWDSSWFQAPLPEEEKPPPEAFTDEDLDEETHALCVEIWRKHERRQAQARNGLLAYFSTIPHQMVRLVAPFSERQWHLLSLLARCPGAKDLLVSNPALAYALASNWVFHRPAVQRPLRAARALLGKKQRTLAEWLGFPGTEAAVRVLRKIEPNACLMGALLRLRNRMQDPATLRQLSHFPPLDAASLGMFLHPSTAPWVTAPFLEQARAAEQTHDCAGDLADVIEMRQFLGVPQPPRRLTSIAQLRILHNDLVERMRRSRQHPTGGPPFPPPPIPGTENLVPITTANDLLEEGRFQHNCVGAYAGRIRRGHCYIYRLLAPERATVEIVLRKNGWRLGEVAARENQAVRLETRQQLKAWVDAFAAAQRPASTSRA